MVAGYAVTVAMCKAAVAGRAVAVVEHAAAVAGYAARMCLHQTHGHRLNTWRSLWTWWATAWCADLHCPWRFEGGPRQCSSCRKQVVVKAASCAYRCSCAMGRLNIMFSLVDVDSSSRCHLAGSSAGNGPKRWFQHRPDVARCGPKQQQTSTTAAVSLASNHMQAGFTVLLPTYCVNRHTGCTTTVHD